MAHFSYLLIYLFIFIYFYYYQSLLFIHLLIIIILPFSNFSLIHLFDLIILFLFFTFFVFFCFREIYQWIRRVDSCKTLRRKKSFLGIIEDHQRVKIWVNKVLKKVGLLGDMHRLFF